MATAYSLPPGFGRLVMGSLPAHHISQTNKPKHASVTKKVSWATGDRLCQVIPFYLHLHPLLRPLFLRVLRLKFFWIGIPARASGSDLHRNEYVWWTRVSKQRSIFQESETRDGILNTNCLRRPLGKGNHLSMEGNNKVLKWTWKHDFTEQSMGKSRETQASVCITKVTAQRMRVLQKMNDNA